MQLGVTAWRAALGLLGQALVLASCADDDGKGHPTISGIAVEGAPIRDALVMARCSNGMGFSSSVRTDEEGYFLGGVEPDALPCALQLSGGSLTKGIKLHGLATSQGIANITPITDLALALASAETPSSWFAGADFMAVAPDLDDALEALRVALEDAGYTVPPGNPFTLGLAPGGDDAWNHLLAQLEAAIVEDPELDTYADLMDRVRSGELESLPRAPAQE